MLSARGRRLWFVLSVFLMTTAATASAADTWTKLIASAPKGANSVGLVDVEALRNYVARLQRSKKSASEEKELNHLLAELPPTIERAAMIAWLDHDSLEPVWEFSSVGFQKGKAPTIRNLVEKEQGYQDVVIGTPVVWSPRGRYFMQTGTDRLAVLRPADRPLLARWLRKSKTTSEEMSSFLRKVADRATDRSVLVLGLDMADVVSQVQSAEKAASLRSVSDAGLSNTAVGTLFSTLRGVSLDIQVRDRLEGDLKIEFNTSPKLLEQAGKSIILEILGRRGLMLPELKSWGARVEGDSLVLSGPLEPSSLVDLLTFLSSSTTGSIADHSPTNSTSPGQAQDSGTPAPPNNPPAQASKKYYDGVQRVVSECRNLKGLTVAEHGYWNDKLSRKIDQLPMLNVDPDLLDYGSKTAQLLRDSGLTIRNANMGASTQRVPSYTGYVNTGNGYWGSGSWAVNDNRHHNSMVDQQARVEGMGSHYGNLKVIDDMTVSIRRAMTAKYKIEF